MYSWELPGMSLGDCVCAVL